MEEIIDSKLDAFATTKRRLPVEYLAKLAAINPHTTVDFFTEPGSAEGPSKHFDDQTWWRDSPRLSPHRFPDHIHEFRGRRCARVNDEKDSRNRVIYEVPHTVSKVTHVQYAAPIDSTCRNRHAPLH